MPIDTNPLSNHPPEGDEPSPTSPKGGFHSEGLSPAEVAAQQAEDSEAQPDANPGADVTADDSNVGEQTTHGQEEAAPNADEAGGTTGSEQPQA